MHASRGASPELYTPPRHPHDDCLDDRCRESVSQPAEISCPRNCVDLRWGSPPAADPLVARAQGVSPANHAGAAILTVSSNLFTFVLCPPAKSKSAKSGKRTNPANLI